MKKIVIVINVNTIILIIIINSGNSIKCSINSSRTSCINSSSKSRRCSFSTYNSCSSIKSSNICINNCDGSSYGSNISKAAVGIVT